MAAGHESSTTMTHLPGSCHPALAAKVAPFKYAGTKLSSCTVEGSHRLAISLTCGGLAKQGNRFCQVPLRAKEAWAIGLETTLYLTLLRSARGQVRQPRLPAKLFDTLSWSFLICLTLPLFFAHLSLVFHHICGPMSCFAAPPQCLCVWGDPSSLLSRCTPQAHPDYATLWSLNSYLLSHVGPWNKSLRPLFFLKPHVKYGIPYLANSKKIGIPLLANLS